MSVIDYKSVLIRSVLAMAIGVLFWIFGTEMLTWSVWGLGGLVVFGAVVNFAIKVFSEKTVSGSDFIKMIFLSALGLFVMYESDFFAKFIIYCLGILLIVGGIGQLSIIAASRRVINVALPFTSYLMPLAFVAVGLLICFDPFDSLSVLLKIFGIGAIFYGVNDLFTQIRLRRQLKRMGKTIRHGDVEDLNATEDVSYEEVK